MRYRKLDANGDYSFGQGMANFYVDSPQAVAQAVETRLRLQTGEWFLDSTEGTPYQSEVLGTGTAATRDAAIQLRIAETQGFKELLSYSSNVDGRKFSVEATIDTIYGETSVSA